MKNYKTLFVSGIISITLIIISIFYPLLSLGLILLIPVVLGMILFPIIGILLLTYSGRFSNVIFLNDLEGPFYIGLMFILLSLITLIIRKNKGVVLTNSYYVVINAIFGIYLLSSSFESEYGAIKSLEFLLYVLPMVFLVLVFINSKEKIFMFIKCIMLLSIGFAIVGFLLGGFESGRLSVLGGGSNVYGRFMVFGLISVLPLIHIEKSKMIKVIFVFLFIVFATLIYFTGSRQAIIGILLAPFLYLLLYLIKISYTKKIKIISGSLLVGLFAISVIPLFVENYLEGSLGWNRLMLLMDDDKGASVSTRTDMLAGAWNMFKEKPFIGWGTGAFADEYSYYLRYPHNIIFELISENGLIGISLFSLVILTSMYSTYKVLKIIDKDNTKEISLVITILVFFLVSIYFSQISGDLYDSRWIWLYGSILASLPYIFKVRLKENQSDS